MSLWLMIDCNCNGVITTPGHVNRSFVFFYFYCYDLNVAHFLWISFPSNVLLSYLYLCYVFWTYTMKTLQELCRRYIPLVKSFFTCDPVSITTKTDINIIPRCRVSLDHSENKIQNFQHILSRLSQPIPFYSGPKFRSRIVSLWATTTWLMLHYFSPEDFLSSLAYKLICFKDKNTFYPFCYFIVLSFHKSNTKDILQCCWSQEH